MKDLKDLINESILDVDKDHQILCILQKPKFDITFTYASGSGRHQYGEIHGEKNEVIGLYEFYDSTISTLTIYVSNDVYNKWGDYSDMLDIATTKRHIFDQCQAQVRKLFGRTLKNVNVTVRSFAEYVDSIEGGFTPLEEITDKKSLKDWIKWLKFWNKTVEKIDSHQTNLFRDVSEKKWETYI